MQPLANDWSRRAFIGSSLAARGGFVVNATFRNGRIQSLELEPQAGTECRMRNPWGSAAVTLRRGGRSETASGELIRFATAKGERIRVTPA